MASPNDKPPNRADVERLDVHAQIAYAVGLAMVSGTPAGISESLEMQLTGIRATLKQIVFDSQWPRLPLTTDAEKKLPRLAVAIAAAAEIEGYAPPGTALSFLGAGLMQVALATHQVLGGQVPGSSDTAVTRIREGMQNLEAALHLSGLDQASVAKVAWDAFNRVTGIEPLQHRSTEHASTNQADIAECLVKFKWSRIARILFSVKRKNIALSSAAMFAPGREVAYISQARERFGR